LILSGEILAPRLHFLGRLVFGKLAKRDPSGGVTAGRSVATNQPRSIGKARGDEAPIAAMPFFVDAVVRRV
jgi:hypothetical protein